MYCWQCGSMPAGISRPGARKRSHIWRAARLAPSTGTGREEWGVIRRPRQGHNTPILSSKCFPPRSPHPRLFIAARTYSSITRTSPACVLSCLQAPCTPIDLQCSLDPISLTPSAFTTCTSSHLFISGGEPFFRSPTSHDPLVSPICRVHRFPLRSRQEVDSVAVLPLRFPFSALCLFDYDLQYFRLCIILYQAMHLRCFFLPIWCKIRVLIWARC
ncbi:hypothetical protein B0H13DRAFT_598170 [Mycena leptocephala]|nr:hypothetical protein B0H13DRAFT_598170 [Mycena leptocephala]